MDERAEREDRELILRMASRDANALDAFYTRYNRVAFSLILRIVGNRQDAEDVLMDAFWQVWQQSGRYDSSRGKPIAWLLTIARTRAIDCTRSNQRRQGRTEELEADKNPATGPAEPDSFVLSDTRRAVQEACKRCRNSRKSRLRWHTFRE